MFPRACSVERWGLFAHLIASIRRPEFWAYSTWLDIVTKYRRTRLGVAWLLLPTLVFITVLGNVYSHLMGHPVTEYLPYLAVGYACWRFMLQCINESSTVFRGHKAFIMDGRVRFTDYVLRAIAKPLFYFTFALVIVIGVLVWSPAVSWIGIFSMLVSLPVLILNMMWISFCVGLVGARFPDTSEFIGTVLVVGFLLTPILWHVDRFPADTTRGFFARLNPAFHLIEVVRAPALGQMPESGSLWAVAAMTIFGWLLMAVLYRRYARFVPLWI
ncbi:ABC transporter permease [Luteimonas sp. SJ-92]|uniref:ABC transporter permease n=1 Tax=Luteimonas salinisoli TaxID=2752307 RepID=A0A853J9G8_9GAMM|nr:ABC transporter permease [Luteimonas salinisoli]NZA25327.1 ABC transporter permease [Luteimonas salinisoli]